MLLQAIRLATSVIHAETEEVFQLHRLQTIEHYMRLLVVMETFYASWEPPIVASPLWQEFQYRPFPKLHYLRNDIEVLGGSPAKQLQLSPPDSVAAVVGVLYVLEGSMLGGQIIANHLEKTLGLSSENGLSYYRCYGKKNRVQWQIFVDFLGEFERKYPTLEGDVTRAAQATFTVVQHLLSGLNEFRKKEF